MVSAASLVSSPLLQLVLVGVVVLVAVLIGQTLYRSAARVAQQVERRVTGVQRPPLRYVLYDIIWAPLVAFTVIAVIRVAVTALPHTVVVGTAATVLEVGLLGTFLWFAVRVFREVLAVSEAESTGSGPSEA